MNKADYQKIEKSMVNQTYRHANGNLYTVLGLSNYAHETTEHPVQVIYAGVNGNLSSRDFKSWGEKFQLDIAGKPDETEEETLIESALINSFETDIDDNEFEPLSEMIQLLLRNPTARLVLLDYLPEKVSEKTKS